MIEEFYVANRRSDGSYDFPNMLQMIKIVKGAFRNKTRRTYDTTAVTDLQAMPLAALVGES